MFCSKMTRTAYCVVYYGQLVMMMMMMMMMTMRIITMAVIVSK